MSKGMKARAIGITMYDHTEICTYAISLGDITPFVFKIHGNL